MPSSHRSITLLNSINRYSGHNSKQGNRRSHFARAVHSRHPLPGRTNFQRTRRRRNDPLCCMLLLAIERSLLQRARYSALSVGEMRPIVNMSEEDRATDIGNMRKILVNIARVVPEISSRTDRQTQRQTYSSQYFATALPRAK